MWQYYRKAPSTFAKCSGLFLEYFSMKETNSYMDWMAPIDCLLVSQFSQRGSSREMAPSSEVGPAKAFCISGAPTHDSTHLGLARGSGSFLAFPTGFLSASSAVTRWNSASTLPCTKTHVSVCRHKDLLGHHQPSRKSVIMWESARKYSDCPAALF